MSDELDFHQHDGLLETVSSSVYCFDARLDIPNSDVRIVPTTVEGDDGIEVKHTIVVSTKVNNPKDADVAGSDKKSKTYQPAEIEFVKGYAGVESTLTDEERGRTGRYPDSMMVNRDIQPYNNENTNNWQPIAFYNNVNLRNDQIFSYSNEIPRASSTWRQFSFTENHLKQYYCNKCKEMSCKTAGRTGRSKPSSNNGDPKIKLDGKMGI